MTALEATEDEISEAERPIVADLRAAGFYVEHVLSLLRDEGTAWHRSLPVLASHVERGGYPDLLVYRMARMFARPEGLPFWNMLANRFATSSGSGEQEGIAFALGTMATTNHFNDLVRLLHLDGANGRWEFIEPIARVGGEAGVNIVMPYAEEFPYYVNRVLSRSKGTSARPRKYARALKQLADAMAARPEPVLDLDAVEWSTSFDLPDWKRFAKHLRARLGGELEGSLGMALFAAILSAPDDDEQHILVHTRQGVVRLGWFIGDIDVVDVFIFGSHEVRDICDTVLGKYFPDI